MNEEMAIAGLGALASQTRMRVFKCLVAAGPAGLNAGKIASEIGASPSRASFHLNALSQADLVTATRNARQITYCVNFGTMGALLGYLMHDCCKGIPEIPECC